MGGGGGCVGRVGKREGTGGKGSRKRERVTKCKLNPRNRAFWPEVRYIVGDQADDEGFWKISRRQMVLARASQREF